MLKGDTTMREIIYNSGRVKIYKDGEKYELFSIAARNLDGFYEEKLTLQKTYTDVYSRDWMGRTTTWPAYNRNNEKGYAYKAVMNDLKYYE